MKNNKKVKKIVFASVMLLLLLVAGFVIYLKTPYRASASALSEKENCVQLGISVIENEDYIVFEPKDFDGKFGFIFYPGGRVEYESYIPLVKALSEKGVLSILLRVPESMAFLDADAADRVKLLYPEVEEWYVGGHSLGGAMAAYHLANCEENYAGLVLLGAYSTKNLTQKDFKVLTMYGSNDGVLNRAQYDRCLKNLPEGYREVLIVGGNHASFGDYGKQAGDGTLEIEKEEQLEFTVENIFKLMND